MQEFGWFHPDRGYWQTTGEPPEDILADYPEGTVQAPIRPSADHQLDEVTLQWVHTPVVIDLAALKVALKAAIDAAAEVARLKYITPGAGQAMTYQAKAEEARQYLVASAEGDEPDAADYPMLSAEVGITAGTIGAVAVIIDGNFKQWQFIGAAIEAVRLGAKESVSAADSVAAAHAAASEIVWP